MACNIQTLSGCKIEVGTAVAVASCDTVLTAVDFAAVADWTVVGGFTTGGFAGQEWNTAEVKPLTGGTKTAKAGFQSGTLDGTIAWEVTDAGMVVLEAAYASSTLEVATRVTYPNGKEYFGQGLVTKLGLPNGGQEDVMNRDLSVTLNHAPATV